jgi:hypothetical protein
VKLRCAFQYLRDHYNLHTGECECEQPRYATEQSKPNYGDNARLDSGLYGQRWMAETAFLTIKRRFGPAVHPRAWYHQSHELVLTAAVYNLEQALKQ